MPRFVFACVDLKLKENRIKILEFGVGNTSNFSGCGAVIPETAGLYQQSLVEHEPFEIFVNDKYLTNYLFENENCSFLRPKCFTSIRKYDQELAGIIISTCSNNRASEEGGTEKRKQQHYVLKLATSSESNGVFVVSEEDLDDTLKKLLEPSSDLHQDKHARFWQSNDCPVFLAESLESSDLVEIEDSDNKKHLFDCTMRVGFLLDIDTCEYVHLGSYWKVPSKWVHSSASQVASSEVTAETSRATIISDVASGGTFPVSKEHDSTVQTLLQMYIPRVFAQVLSPGFQFVEFVAQQADSMPRDYVAYILCISALAAVNRRIALGGSTPSTPSTPSSPVPDEDGVSSSTSLTSRFVAKQLDIAEQLSESCTTLALIRRCQDRYDEALECNPFYSVAYFERAIGKLLFPCNSISEQDKLLLVNRDIIQGARVTGWKDAYKHFESYLHLLPASM